MGIIRPGDLDKLVRIERPVEDGSLTAAGKKDWALVGEVYASIVDALPSRSEQMSEGINISKRPARVRIYYREDVTAAMRFAYGARLMKIVAGPAEIGSHEGLEFMVETFG